MISLITKKVKTGAYSYWGDVHFDGYMFYLDQVWPFCFQMLYKQLLIYDVVF